MRVPICTGMSDRSGLRVVAVPSFARGESHETAQIASGGLSRRSYLRNCRGYAMMAARLEVPPPPRLHMKRREFLRVGLSGLGSLSLPGLFRLRVEAGSTTGNPRTALIVVWLRGGASHLETYDPKPEANSEFRGPFSSIETRVPGLRLGELLPRHAAIADRIAIVRPWPTPEAGIRPALCNF